MKQQRATHQASGGHGQARALCADASAITAGIQMGAAFMVIAVWLFSLRQGPIGRFDQIGMPVVSILLAAMGVAVLQRPPLIRALRLPLLLVLFTYAQLSLFIAVFAHGTRFDVQAVSRIGLFIPLLYLASFALLVRQAYRVLLMQAALVSLQCALGLVAWWHQAPAALTQNLFAMIVLQPLYLALLYWIHHQRRETISAQASASASRLAMLAMVAHELRSPLQTIVSALSAQERRLNALGLPKAELTQVHRMRSAAAQLDSHLSDLLVITKRQGELAPARRQPFRLDLALQSLAENYVGAARDRGCVIRLDVGSGCEAVEGDALRVHQVLNNLLNNAVKYTREGDIVVAAARLDQTLVQLTVRDTGIGIDQARIATIWEPHVRMAHDPHVALAEGHGLGLAVVRLLVGMLEGTVSITSEPGHGTEVALRLPLPMATR